MDVTNSALRLKMALLFARFRARLFHMVFLATRPMTLGARALIYDTKTGGIFLIRHTYVPGWQLPGGGVEAGETAHEALVREIQEECNITLNGQAKLHQLYFNRQSSRRDHIAVYLATDFEVIGPRKPDHEIAEGRFFSIKDLPAETTPATRRRIAEILGGLAASPYW